MPFYSTGEGRDSYITGIRPSGRFGEFHDVEQRRDNLPANVFSFVKEGVIREERMRLAENERRYAGHMQYIYGTTGKKMAGGTSGDELREIKKMEAADQLQKRHDALGELYSKERELWEAQLAGKGLALYKHV
eukprot:gene8603-6039_t